MEVAHVPTKETRKWNVGGIGIYGAVHMWNALYVNNTVLLRPEGYKWVEWNGPAPPTKKKEEKRFPWVLYSRKFRNKRR